MRMIELYRDLSPWLCAPLDRTGRAYLEAHLELLADEFGEFLEIFVKEFHDSPEQRELCTLQSLLQDARERGGTRQAVCEAYVNAFGGLTLDLPPWLQEIEQRLLALPAGSQLDHSVVVCKMQLRDAIEDASKGRRVAPEIVAELQYRLGELFVNYAQDRSTTVFQTATKYYEAALRVYSASRYPQQYAKVLATLEGTNTCLAPAGR